MPRFLEEKLKKKYGASSDMPYKIMNKLGFMKGNKETSKGAAAQAKHDSGIKGEMDKEKEVSLIKHKILNAGESKKLHQLNSDILMGKPHHSKPASNDNKLMSQEHKLDRAHIDSMDDGVTSKESVIRAGIKYDERHENEHKKSKIKAKKMLSDHLRGKLASAFIKGTSIKKD